MKANKFFNYKPSYNHPIGFCDEGPLRIEVCLSDRVPFKF